MTEYNRTLREDERLATSRELEQRIEVECDNLSPLLASTTCDSYGETRPRTVRESADFVSVLLRRRTTSTEELTEFREELPEAETEQSQLGKSSECVTDELARAREGRGIT